ncbi:MAG: DUF2378 family protein, partial [Archangium sp.]
MSVIAKHSMFDGLFSVALQPTGAFRDDLKAAGFDADRPRPEYPLEVWHDCLDVAARHLHPDETRERAWELLGAQFIEGYLKTLVGRIIAVAMPFLSPQSFVQRAPRFMSTGLVGADVSLDWSGSKAATVTMAYVPHPSGHLLAGV